MKPMLVVTMRRIDTATKLHLQRGGCTIILITPSLLATKMGGPDQSGSGGGSPTLRRQLQVLRLSARFGPRENASRLCDRVMAPGVVVRGLSEPGRQYAFYLYGRGPTFLKLNLPAGTYESQWIEVDTGRSLCATGVASPERFRRVEEPGI